MLVGVLPCRYMIKTNKMINEFTNALKGHDWFFDFSDDHSVWTRGFNSKKNLESMAHSLVANGETPAEVATLWNQYAPERFQVGNETFAPKAKAKEKVFKNKLARPSMNQVVTLKKQLGISASEANFRLRYGVEPSQFEIDFAQQNQGRFVFHFPSHPELWEEK